MPDEPLAITPAWIACADELPPEGVVVQVKNNNGTTLKRSGRLWFLPDGSMYVYYVPEFWRPITPGGIA